MKAIFFGDSITAGSNSDVAFTKYLSQIKPNYEIINYGVSGTTIGEYSIYPVDGNSLLSQINRYKTDIKYADYIFLEYGLNDVSSIMCGFTTIQTVVISLVKAVDWIKQLNPYAKIMFVCIGSKNIMEYNASSMCDYLQNDYFGKFNFKFPKNKYMDIYSQILLEVDKICDKISLFDGVKIDKEVYKWYLSNDHLHPNKDGHGKIAAEISKYM